MTGLLHFPRRVALAIATWVAATSSDCLQCALAQIGDLPVKPNVVFILADDLGYGDLGCYGQKVIKTPRLDRMASEGMRFTQFYAGNTVCAPSRSVLMTGQHMGHTHVRGNAGGTEISKQTLRSEDFTVAELFKQSGYKTGLIGKWGLGEIDSPGHPMRKGFDEFFGYLNQTHAHNYYPEYLWRGTEQQPLRNRVNKVDGNNNNFIGGTAVERIDYSHDLFVTAALDFLDQHKSDRFFLYLPLTIPHANNEGTRMIGNGAEVPDFGIYAEGNWSDNDKGQAAMITRMDADIGRLLDRLRELGLDKNTLVLFTSDNGPHNEANHNLDRFKPSGPLRGIKRSLYEGGVRVPLIAWWPGRVASGTTSNHIGYFGDFFATVAELIDTACPEKLDSVSFLPTLIGKATAQGKHPYLYWEFYEQGSRQAVRFGNWKAIREPMLTGDVQLFNLENDLGERTNIAGTHALEFQQAITYMNEAHVPHPNWVVPKPANSR